MRGAGRVRGGRQEGGGVGAGWDRPSRFVVGRASQKPGWLTDDKRRSSVPPSSFSWPLRDELHAKDPAAFQAVPGPRLAVILRHVKRQIGRAGIDAARLRSEEHT